MAAYQRGDERAFIELFRCYTPVLVSFFVRRGKRRVDAQDLTQETFLRLHRARADFRKGEALRPWLFAIARNLCRDHRRSCQRRPLSYGEVADFAAQSEVVPLANAERKAALSFALAQLPASDRSLLDEHWLAERAFSELAAREGVRSSTLRVRAHRACRRLREALSVRERAVA